MDAGVVGVLRGDYLVITCLLSACVGIAPQIDTKKLHAPSLTEEGLVFSTLTAPSEAQAPFINRPLLPNKQLTQYTPVDGTSVGLAKTVVMRATAEKSASLLLKKLPQPLDAHHVRWSWRVDQPNQDARTADPKLEYSPVRVVLAFAAPNAAALADLPFKDQLFLQTAKLMHKEEPPYATLMYTWSNDLAQDTVISSAHTGRIRMLVAESGAARTGQWLKYDRNIAADYQRAFGSAPGKLIAIAILSDTDNTRLTTTAYYSDVVLYKPSAAE